MTIGSIAGLPPGSVDRDRPRNLREAAEAFEALLLSQLLRAARENCGEDEPDSQIGASIFEIAEEHLAKAIASSGGGGLAAIITRQLQPNTDNAQGNADPSADP